MGTCGGTTTTHPTETPVAVILHGFPGTGKSTFARRLAAGNASWVVIDKDDVKRALMVSSRFLSADGTKAATPERWAETVLSEFRDSDSDSHSHDEIVPNSRHPACDLVEGAISEFFESRRSRARKPTTAPMVVEISDDEINELSYKVMIALAKFVLLDRRNLIVDSPLCRADVFHALVDACTPKDGAKAATTLPSPSPSPSPSHTAIVHCHCSDDSIWDARLRDRHSRTGGQTLVRKPATLAETRALYDEERTKEIADMYETMQSLVDAGTIHALIKVDAASDVEQDAAVRRILEWVVGGGWWCGRRMMMNERYERYE